MTELERQLKGSIAAHDMAHADDEYLAAKGTAAAKFLGRAKAFAIVDADGHRFAQQQMLLAKGALTEIEMRRTAITKPLNESLRQINAMFKDVGAPYAEAERVFKAKISSYEDEARRAQAEAIARAAELKRQAAEEAAKAEELAASTKKQDVKLAIVANEAAKTALGAANEVIASAPALAAVEGVSTHEQAFWEVEDINQVPEKFIVRSVNKALLDAELDVHGAKLAIPGIKVGVKTVVRASRTKGLRQ